MLIIEQEKGGIIMMDSILYLVLMVVEILSVAAFLIFRTRAVAVATICITLVCLIVAIVRLLMSMLDL